MAPATFLSSGTIQPLCPTCSATKRWQPKRLVSSRSALTRALPQANINKASVKSSIPLGSLDSVFGRRRRSGLGSETRSPSRPVFTAAVDVEGSIAVDETSSALVTVSESEEEKIAEFATDAAVPPPSKTERFKPRVPGQKIRREDPTVPGEALVEGAVFTGRVTTIQPFGAFVNFGAFTDGLVHISKMSTGYVSNVNDIVSLGQEVKVTILNVEQKSGRIALSMVDKEELEAKVVAGKTGEASEGGGRSRFQQGPDGRPVNRGRIAGGGRQSRRDEPQKPPTKLSKGQEVEGTVKNKIRSGVFVELPENEEGFLRYSDIPGGENMAPESSLQTGEKIKATVLKIDRGKVVLTMRPILDISSVNRDINKGSDSGATNPFEIAFRAFNLVPAEPTSPVEEDSAEESVPPEASVDVEEVIPEAAAVVEEVISEVTAGIEESASVEQEVIPEAPTAEDEVASVAIPEVAAVAEDSPATVDEGPAEEKLIPTLDEIPSESVPETKAALEEAPTVEEEVISVAIPEVAAVAEDSPAAVEEAPTAEEEVPLVTVPEVAAVAKDSSAAVDEAPAEEKLVPTLDETPFEAPAEEELIPKFDEILFGSVPETKAAVEEVPIAEEEVGSVAIPEAAGVAEDSSGAGDEGPADEELIPKLDEILFGSVPETKAAVEEAPTAEEEVGSVAIPEVATVAEDSSGADDEAPADEELIPKLDEILFGSVPETKAAVEEAPTAEEEAGSVPIPEVAAVAEGSSGADDEAPADEELIPKLDEILFGSVPETKAAVEEAPTAEEEAGSVPIPEVAAVAEGSSAADDEAPADEELIPKLDEILFGSVPETKAAVEEAPTAEEEVGSVAIPEVAAVVENAPAEEKLIAETVLAVAEAAVAGEEVIPEAAASATVRESSAEKVTAGISPALVKQLRDETGAGMMDCKRALADTNGDIEKARETLRKKGLASADKKASRVASEGLVGSYIHDSRIGVLVEVNCETDFVSRGPSFKSLVEDLGMQVVACPQVQFVSLEDIPVEIASKEKEMEAQREDLMNKPEAIRARIVEGRVSKRLNEIALLEQPFIRDDSILVTDFVKQTIAYLGENIKVRRFERFVLGEGLQKKGTDFATEVAAQTGVKAPPVESPKTEEAPAPAPAPPPGPENKVVVSAALVKELRDQTGAGMMDCKKALTATENDVEKAVEFLRKKGLASAEKKASRLASEGLIGTYVHDGRIGILVEVNCETDFVARGERFKELVEDLAMQIAAYPQVQVVSVDDVPAEMVAKEKELESEKEDLASKPEAIRARIVDGRVAKRLSELALLDQPFIKDDKKLVKDILKETVAALGENIQVRRFTRFNLGENIEKKIVDFASEVAAQSQKGLDR